MFAWPIDDDLSLRLWEESDAAHLAALIRADAAHIGHWLPFATDHYEESDALTYIRRVRKEWAVYESLETALVVDGQVAGSVGLHGMDPVHRQAALGYWILSAYTGRGLVTRACRALTDYAVGPLGMNRVELRAQPANVKSRAVAERLGFQQEGILRSVMWHPDGPVDHVVYSILASEWTPRG